MSLLLSTGDAQKYLGVKRYIFEHHIRPKVETIKIGRKIFFKKVALDRVISHYGAVDGGPLPEKSTCIEEAQFGTSGKKLRSAKKPLSYERVRERLLRLAQKPSETFE